MKLLYDLETSGLLKKGTIDPLKCPGIVQIGAVKLDDDWNEVAHFETLVDPEMPALAWEEGAIKAHGIKPEAVKGAPSFFTAAAQFAEFAVGCSLLGGYNHTEFDNEVLLLQLKRYGLEQHFPWPPTHFDVMKAAAEHFAEPGRYGNKYLKLGDAYQRLFKEPLIGAHDALTDIRATARIMKEIWL